MNLEQYIIDASRTCPALEPSILENRAPNLLDNLHMVLGMETEISELSDVFKKHLAYNKPIDWVNVEEELADILWYLVNFARINNLDIQKSLDKNIAKLKQRFPNKFEEHLAIHRDVDKERLILEQ